VLPFPQCLSSVARRGVTKVLKMKLKTLKDDGKWKVENLSSVQHSTTATGYTIHSALHYTTHHGAMGNGLEAMSRVDIGQRIFMTS
jgi:hypothetical protein